MSQRSVSYTAQAKYQFRKSFFLGQHTVKITKNSSASHCSEPPRVTSHSRKIYIESIFIHRYDYSSIYLLTKKSDTKIYPFLPHKIITQNTI